MRTFRKSTIRDVAEHAGVSTTTVSLFISGRESVCSHETALRIRRAVGDLKYTPNSLTRGLRRTQQTTLGVCLSSPMDPDLAYGIFFFESIWRGIIAEADKDNYCLLHYPTGQRSGKTCDALLDGRVDGIVIHDQSVERAKALCDAGMPTVAIASTYDLPSSAGAAYADDIGVSNLALEHLWELGHRRIAHVAGPVGEREPGRATAREPREWLWRDDIAVRRYDGYTSWMSAHGVFDPDLIVFARSWDRLDLTAALARWRSLPAPPTAIYCSNDSLALSVLDAAQRLGLRAPNDFSVVGVDDCEASRLSSPALTSVRVPVLEVGRAAIRAMLNLIAGHPIDECRIKVPVLEIAVRATTAARAR